MAHALNTEWYVLALSLKSTPLWLHARSTWILQRRRMCSVTPSISCPRAAAVEHHLRKTLIRVHHRYDQRLRGFLCIYNIIISQWGKMSSNKLKKNSACDFINKPPWQILIWLSSSPQVGVNDFKPLNTVDEKFGVSNVYILHLHLHLCI